MWYPDHLSEQYASEALASKLVKLKRSGGLAYSAKLDKHCYDSTPADHWNASATVDKVVVFGLQAKASGIWVPNEIIAEYVAQHPRKLEGWASIDPNEPDCVEQLEYCVKTLGLKGLKLGPVYTHFDPQALWDPYCGSSVQNGHTTIVVGQCGQVIAPARPGTPRHLAGWRPIPNRS